MKIAEFSAKALDIFCPIPKLRTYFEHLVGRSPSVPQFWSCI
jgi:hypothetical protein